MKIISVYDAVETVLAHDLTQIIPGQFKGSRYKKGYIIKEEDIPVLLEMGKRNLFVLELGDNDVHEDEAAIRLAKAAAGTGIELRVMNEGTWWLLQEACQLTLMTEHHLVFVKQEERL